MKIIWISMKIVFFVALLLITLQQSGSGSIPSSIVGSSSGSSSGSTIGSGSIPQCLVYNVSLTHMFEDVEAIPANIGSGSYTLDNLLVPMEGGRATDEYKHRAITFFKNQYGLDFSGNIQGLDFTPMSVNPLLKYYLSSAYASQLPKAFFPSSNLRVAQDFWQVKINDNNQHDLNGKLNGVKMSPNQFVAYGEFRYLDAQSREIIPKIIFKTPVPLDINEIDIPNTVGSGSTAVSIPMTWRLMNVVYHLESAQFGKGIALGVQLQIVGNRKNINQERVNLSFPSLLSDLTTTPSVASKCVNIST